MVQYFFVLSVKYPDASRNAYPTNSPNPATTPTAVALAPSTAKKGPVMLRAPSYVKSENRLTTPIKTTNLMAAGLEISLNSVAACNGTLMTKNPPCQQDQLE